MSASDFESVLRDLPRHGALVKDHEDMQLVRARLDQVLGEP